MSQEFLTPKAEPSSAREALVSPATRPAKRAVPFARQAYQCLWVAALAAASYFFISHVIVQSVQVVGFSMTPTLHDSERYLLNRWVYHLRAPQRSEVVAIRDPADHGFSVKRIIAASGDRVYLKDGNVYVNGCRLAEPYLATGTLTFPPPIAREQLITYGKDQYYVLGDNRNNSADSRLYGPIPRQSILGLIMH